MTSPYNIIASMRSLLRCVHHLTLGRILIDLTTNMPLVVLIGTTKLSLETILHLTSQQQQPLDFKLQLWLKNNYSV